MLVEKMHFTGTIWRPPYEANSLLLQVTSGCSHNKCKFCSMYHDLPFKVSPVSEVEADLNIIRQHQPDAERVFLVGANPFVLSYNKLVDLATLIQKYLPKCKSIGGYARITDFTNKTLDELKDLCRLGYNGVSIGTESGDDVTLELMNKGMSSEEILTECHKLEKAGIEYGLSFLNGLAGHGNGQRNALKSAEVYNQLKPFIVFVMSLMVTPNSELFKEVQRGEFVEATKQEMLEELKAFIEPLTLKTFLFINSSYLPMPISGSLPEDKPRILQDIKRLL